MSSAARLTTALACAAAAVGAAAPAAQAAWPGTPGKVAYLERKSGLFDLKVWTPKLGTGTEITAAEDTYHFQDVDQGDTEPMTHGFPSPPAWSPDGTKIAFAKKVADTGLGNGATHTAIFVYDVRDKSTTQVTTPPAGKLDPSSEPPEEGYAHADYAPQWSPDGSKIAYIRMIEAGRDEPIHAQRGGNVRIVSLTGGGSSWLTTDFGDHLYTALSWGGDPKGQTALVALHARDGQGFLLERLDPASGAVTVLQSGASAAMVRDFDVTPDGLGVDLVRVDGSGDRRRFDGPTTALGSGLSITNFRSSPNGNGPLHLGMAFVPGFGQRGGIVERRAPDPSGDVWPEDPQDRWVNGLIDMSGKYAVGTVGRSLWDVQPQRLPIVNIPGFAGSAILCGGEQQWAPGVFGNDDRLQNMRLGDDGKTNATCADAGPTQDPNADTGFVSSAFGKEIYAPQERWIDEIAPGDRGWRFSWDWRKAPSESLARLDELIGRALDTDFAREQGLDRVVLYGHSYGGLLMRQYVETHPEKVARTLTAGTPYLGVPKPLFFVSFGVENPTGGIDDLDSFLPNADAKLFARNAAGAYHLFPGANYGAWLTVDGTFQSYAQTKAWLTGVGGANGALLDQARAWHQQYDGFTTKQSTIEARAVIGTGLLSIGSIAVPAAPAPDGTVQTSITMTDGDVTVPTKSAHQGPLGTHTPLGDPVHVQAVCRVSHMELGGHPKVTEKYTEFLLSGRTPRKTEGGCKPSGTVLEVREFEDPLARRASRALEPTDTLTAAARAGDVQLIEVPGAPLVVTRDDRPVDLQLGGGDRALTVKATRYVDGDPAGTQTFSGLDGDVRFVTGAGGTASLTEDGQAVAPDAGGGGPQDPGPQDPQPPATGGTGGGTTPTGTAPTPAPSTATPPAAGPKAATLKLTAVTARRRGTKVVVTVKGTLTGAGPVAVKAAAGKVKAAKGVAPKGGTFSATLTLKRPKGKVTVTATSARAAGYSAASAKRVVAVKRR